MLTAHPDMKGIFAIWTQPAMQVVDAAKASGRDIPITTIDLGESSARNIAKDGRIKGLGAQKPFDQGVAEVNMMAMSLLGEETPLFVTGRAFPVMRKNLLEAYPKVFHKDPSEAITKHYQ
jgi:ribose transport system substrate-binding protein